MSEKNPPEVSSVLDDSDIDTDSTLSKDALEIAEEFPEENQDNAQFMQEVDKREQETMQEEAMELEYFRRLDSPIQKHQRELILALIKEKFGPEVSKDFQTILDKTTFELPTLDNPAGVVNVSDLDEVKTSFDKLSSKFTPEGLTHLVSKFKSAQLDKSDSEDMKINVKDMPDFEKSARVLRALKNGLTNQAGGSTNSSKKVPKLDIDQDFLSIIKKFIKVSPKGKVLIRGATHSEKNLLKKLKDKLGAEGAGNLLTKYKNNSLNLADIITLERRLGASKEAKPEIFAGTGVKSESGKTLEFTSATLGGQERST